MITSPYDIYSFALWFNGKRLTRTEVRVRFDVNVNEVGDVNVVYGIFASSAVGLGLGYASHPSLGK